MESDRIMTISLSTYKTKSHLIGLRERERGRGREREGERERDRQRESFIFNLMKKIVIYVLISDHEAMCSMKTMYSQLARSAVTSNKSQVP